MTAPGEVAGSEPRPSFTSDDVVRAAELMIELYGMDAVHYAERIKPPGRDDFAEAVLQEIKARLAQ